MSDSIGPPDENSLFPSAKQDAAAAEACEALPQTTSPSYRLAYADADFLQRPELRSVRLQLEQAKAELVLSEHGVTSTVVVFGSSRIPAPDETTPTSHSSAAARRLAAKSGYYTEARAFARLVVESQLPAGECCVVMTGGGYGIMEAANRGAAEAGAKSVGLNIVLPKEQTPNRYITPALSFQFHYFAIRKLEFLLHAKALAIFPGGFGTLDELFDALTLIQTGKMRRIPIVLFGSDYWRRIIDFEVMVEEGVIDRSDADLIDYAETAAEGWRIIHEFYAARSRA